MAPARINGDQSALAMFAGELRAARAKVGMSRDELGTRINYSGSLVGLVESMTRVPTLVFSQRLDEALGTPGTFERMQEHLRAAPFPSWFRDWLEIEREALSLRTWEPVLVPGLLQTADYARALFKAWQASGSDEDELDQMVAARMDRQSILSRDKPPALWVVLDEAVLHRCIGSPKVMYDQLHHLDDMADRPNVTIQVVPAEVGTHAGLLGAFIIADFESAPSILYAETAVEGQTVEKPALVRKAALAFDRLRAEALPRTASRNLIGRIAESKWNVT